jgi:hypothetical protein
MAKGEKGVVINAETVERLRRRVQAIDKNLAAQTAERTELVKEIDAMIYILDVLRKKRGGFKVAHALPAPETMAIAASTTGGRSATGSPSANGSKTHELKLGEEALHANDEPSVPMVVKEVLGKKGRLSSVELRNAIIAAGVAPDRLGSGYSYLYTVLSRLLGRGQIIRSRGKYQLPEGVTIETKPEAADLLKF